MQTIKTSALRKMFNTPDDLSVRQRESDRTVMIEFGSMYENPCDQSFTKSREIVDNFGAKNIDWDAIMEGGCETCDYGSRYGAIVTLTECQFMVEADDDTKVSDLR